MGASCKERTAWAVAFVASLASHAIGSDKVLVELEAKATSLTQGQVAAVEAWSRTVWPDAFEGLTELVCQIDWKHRTGSCSGYGVRPVHKDMVPSGATVLPIE